nr:MAG TPA: head to tail adaptor [Caudoviricetes sp.]
MTVKLYSILTSLIDNADIETNFTNKFNQLYHNNPNYNISRMISNYQEDGNELTYLVQYYLTYGLQFLGDNRKRFEKELLSKFYNRKIKVQTIDLWNNLLVGFVSEHQDVIKNMYEIDKWLKGQSNTRTTSDSQGENRTNNINSSQPQTQTNITLNQDSIDYADDLSINKGKSTNSNVSTYQSENHDLKTLIDYQKITNEFWNKLDLALFSQVG